jgi:hypothetical protein
MNKLVQIKQNAGRILGELPGHVTLLAAAKTRTIDEVTSAYEGGIRHFGHNYVQEAQGMIPGVGFDARWHMIGHLQRNKAGQAIELFHMIESLDSAKLAFELEKRCDLQEKNLDVLIEVNSGLEEEKTGISPQQAEDLAWAMSELAHLRLVGLMTMGPFTGDPEDSRPYFTRTRRLFEHLGGLGIPNMEMRVLSMGMSNNYRVAIEEGATLVRIGTLLFGPRA